jgi:hypothetical protein
MPGETPPGGFRGLLDPSSHVGTLHPAVNTCLPHRHVDDLTIWFLVGSLYSVDCRAAASMIVWSSLSDGGGEDPLSKRAHPWHFLPTSSRYAHGVNFYGTPFLLLLFQDSGFEGNIVLVAGAVL